MVRVKAEQHACRSRAQRVEHAEKPRYAYFYIYAALRRAHGELRAGGGYLYVACEKVRLFPYAERSQRDIKPFCYACTVRIVRVHNGAFGLQKQLFLRRKIIIKRFMIVKMVLRKVRKYAYVELHAVHPRLVQRMGRNLHHHQLNAGVLHVPQYFLKVNACGRGALGLQYSVAYQVVYCAYQANLQPRLLGDALYHVCRTGFAVGSGNAYHLHFPGRIAVICRRHFCHCNARVRHDKLRQIYIQPALYYQRRRACFLCHWRVFMPIGKRTRYAAEKIALVYLS